MAYNNKVFVNAETKGNAGAMFGKGTLRVLSPPGQTMTRRDVMWLLS